MNTNIIDPLPAGSMTWGGKTNGPAINLGRLRPHMVGGRMFYLHLDELRDIVVKAGWPLPDQFARLERDLGEVEDEYLDLQHAHEEALAKIDALEAALGWKQKSEPEDLIAVASESAKAMAGKKKATTKKD